MEATQAEHKARKPIYMRWLEEVLEDAAAMGIVAPVNERAQRA